MLVPSFYLHPLWFVIMMMVNSRSSSRYCFVTGPLNWGTVCRIYIVIHYVRLPDIGNVQKILYSLFSIVAMPPHNRFLHCYWTMLPPPIPLQRDKLSKSKMINFGSKLNASYIYGNKSLPFFLTHVGLESVLRVLRKSL